AEVPEREEQVKLVSMPKDTNDEKDVMVEIRGGADDDEAAIIASDLIHMESKSAESYRFRLEIVEETDRDRGGYEEVNLSVAGDGVYSKLKYENGAHRVQR
ncbi:PCRF domain-containing protein, partial [Staphylococcus pseudintermedius]